MKVIGQIKVWTALAILPFFALAVSAMNHTNGTDHDNTTKTNMTNENSTTMALIPMTTMLPTTPPRK